MNIPAFLLATAVLSLATPQHQRFIPHIHYSKIITLHLHYACPSSTPLPDCHFSIHWNGQVLQKTVPQDHQVHQQTASFRADYGENTIRIVGNGKDRGQGIEVSNITLTRTVYQRHLGPKREQLLANSLSEQGSKAWAGQGFKLAINASGKSAWPEGAHVCQLPSQKFISQSVYFGRRMRTITKAQFDSLKSKEREFVLSFDYAAQEDSRLADNRFQVLLNGVSVQELEPRNFAVHKAKLLVRPLASQTNTVTFKSLSANASAGCSFHKVYMRRSMTLFRGRHQPRIIQNGWFQQDRFVISHEETIFDTGMDGWQGKSIDIGVSTQLNSNYDSRSVNHFPVCRLPAHTQLAQSIAFDSDLVVTAKLPTNKRELTLGFSYAAAPGTTLADNQFEVLFNGQRVAQIAPSDFKKHYARYKVEGQVGNNRLAFSGKSAPGSKGVGISFVSLQRINRQVIPFDLIKNKVFNEPKDKNCTSKYWQSNVPLSVVKGRVYGHRWDWDGKGCVCVLPGQQQLHYDFQLTPLYEYIDPRAENVTASKRKTLKLLLGYYPEGGQKLESSKFRVVWNGKEVEEITPKNYYQLHRVLHLTARAGKNVLSLEGTGDQDGKGGAFNYIRLLRSTYYFQPHLLAKLAVGRKGRCSGRVADWKGDHLWARPGKEFNAKAEFSDCLVWMKKGQKILAEVNFNDKWQSI